MQGSQTKPFRCQWPRVQSAVDLCRCALRARQHVSCTPERQESGLNVASSQLIFSQQRDSCHAVLCVNRKGSLPRLGSQPRSSTDCLREKLLSWDRPCFCMEGGPASTSDNQPPSALLENSQCKVPPKHIMQGVSPTQVYYLGASRCTIYQVYHYLH